MLVTMFTVWVTLASKAVLISYTIDLSLSPVQIWSRIMQLKPANGVGIIWMDLNSARAQRIVLEQTPASATPRDYISTDNVIKIVNQFKTYF